LSTTYKQKTKNMIK